MTEDPFDRIQDPDHVCTPDRLCRVCGNPGLGFEEPEIPMTRYHASGSPLDEPIMLSMVGPEEAEARLAAMPSPLDLPDHEVFFEMGEQGGSYRLGIEYTQGIKDEMVEWLAYRQWRQAKIDGVVVDGLLEKANRPVEHRVGEPTEHEHPQTTMLREGLEADRAYREEAKAAYRDFVENVADPAIEELTQAAYRSRGHRDPDRPRTPRKVIEDWSDFGKKDVL